MGPQMFGRFGSSSLEFLGLCTQEERQYDSIASVFVYSLKVSVSCESFCCHLIVVKLLHMGTTRDHHTLQMCICRTLAESLVLVFPSLHLSSGMDMSDYRNQCHLCTWRHADSIVISDGTSWIVILHWFFCSNVLKGRALTSLHSPMSRNATFSIQSK